MSSPTIGGDMFDHCLAVHALACTRRANPALCIKRTNNLADFPARVNHPWGMGTQLYPYKPETIRRALQNLRAQIIRNGEPGLEHVKALLQLRGDNLGPVPRKANSFFRRGKLRVAIFVALRGGPLTGPEVVALVCVAHGLAYGSMYRSVYAQLGQMKKAGQLRHEERVWGLAR